MVLMARIGCLPNFKEDFLDIHAICDTVKRFLRFLPDPLIPFSQYQRAMAIGGAHDTAFCGRLAVNIRSEGITDYETRLTAMRDLVHTLPLPNFYTLRRFLQHLDKYVLCHSCYSSKYRKFISPSILG